MGHRSSKVGILLLCGICFGYSPPAVSDTDLLNKGLLTDPLNKFMNKLRGIENVDFLNFTYSLSQCYRRHAYEGMPRQVTTEDGHFKNERVDVGVFESLNKFTEFAGENNKVAIVPLRCRPLTSKTYVDEEVHVYTLRDGVPTLLTRLDGSTFETDYYRFCPKDKLYLPLHRIEATNTGIIIHKTAIDGYDPRSDSEQVNTAAIKLEYKWTGKELVLAGKPIREPIRPQF